MTRRGTTHRRTQVVVKSLCSGGYHKPCRRRFRCLTEAVRCPSTVRLLVTLRYVASAPAQQRALLRFAESRVRSNRGLRGVLCAWAGLGINPACAKSALRHQTKYDESTAWAHCTSAAA